MRKNATISDLSLIQKIVIKKLINLIIKLRILIFLNSSSPVKNHVISKIQPTTTKDWTKNKRKEFHKST